MKKTALLLVLTMLVSVFSGYGAVFAEEATAPVNGPQEEAFAVSATEPTVLSGVRFTKTNIAAGYWNGTQTFNTVEAYSNTQRYVSYDLDVEEAGAYRVTVKAVAKSDGTYARIYRQGRISQSTGDLDGGDVVLAEAALKSTDGAWSPQDNDFGVIYLEEGSNQIAISSLAISAKSFYLMSVTLTPVEENAPLVFGLRDAKDFNGGGSETLHGTIGTHAVPYISFGGGEYQLYDVTIPEDGLYRFTTFGNYYSPCYTLTDVTDPENPVVLVNATSIKQTGPDASSAYPAEVAKIALNAGDYTFKLSSTSSSHYSYFTLEKVFEIGEKESFIADGETVKVDRTMFTTTTGGSGLDFGYNGYREYKVYAEKEGVYDFILNYSTTAATTMTVAVNGNKYISEKEIEGRGSWGNYIDVNLGKILLKAGSNVLKLTPGSTMNMPYFTLAPSTVAKISASDGTNVTTDALATMSYNGGTAVKVDETQKLDFAVTVPQDGEYEILVEAYAITGPRHIYVSEGEDDLLEAELKGEEHGNWKTYSLGTLELTEGTHNLSFKLDEGLFVYLNTILVTSDEVDVPVAPTEAPTEVPTEAPTEAPSGKGVQAEPFAVSGTEATEFSPLYYTVAGVSGAEGWYDRQNFATLDVQSYTHHFVGYDLDVEKAGAYRVTAKFAAPSEGSVAQIVRKGKTITDTNSVANGCGDVVLSVASVKKTANSSDVAENDLGVIWLDEGITRISIANVRDGGHAYYYYGMTLTPVEEEVPIVVSVRDAVELKTTTGEDKAILGYQATDSAIAPFVQFFAGEEQIYEVEIPEDGVYSFTTFQGGANTYSFYDITDAESLVTLVKAKKVPSNGNSNFATPYEVAQLSLTEGTHMFKLTANEANHYSYFTLRRMGDITGSNAISLPVGKSAKVAYNEYSEAKHSGNLDFTDGGAEGEFGEAVYRIYTFDAEQAGEYALSINYATKEDAGVYVYVNGEEIAAEPLDATGDDWSLTHAVDFKIPYTVYFEEGINTIKLIPEGTFNMPHFTLTQLSANVYNAKDAKNIETDALSEVSYDNGSSVKVMAGQKLTLDVEVSGAGWYVLRSFASATVGHRKITVASGENVLCETTLKGQLHAEYASEILGVIYLADGVNTIDISVSEGYRVFFNNFSISKMSAALYRENGDKTTVVKLGTMTAEVDLAGLYAGETKDVCIAVYETLEGEGTRLAYFNMEEQTITAGEKTEISVLVESLNSRADYTVKVFVWDDMNGFVYEF